MRNLWVHSSVDIEWCTQCPAMKCMSNCMRIILNTSMIHGKHVSNLKSRINFSEFEFQVSKPLLSLA